MAWTDRFRFRRQDDDEPAGEDVEFEEPSKKGDGAFRPRGEQREISARVRRDAEADAVRHAEDMLDRDFPIVAEAEGIGQTRLAELKSGYLERRSGIAERIAGLEAQETEVTMRLRVTEEGLRSAGVPAGQMDLPPLRARPPVAERVAIVLGAAVAVAVVIKLLGLDGTLVLAVAGAGVAALALTLALQPGEPLEAADVTELREAHVAQTEELAELRAQLDRSRSSLRELENQTRSLAEHEVEFAKTLPGLYGSTAFSSLPVGVLAEGRKLKPQRKPTVQLPEWARRLGEAE